MGKFKSAAVEFKILLATSTPAGHHEILPSQLCHIIPYLTYERAQTLLPKITRMDISDMRIWYEAYHITDMRIWYPEKYGGFNQLVDNLLDVHDNGLTKTKFDRIQTQCNQTIKS